jgi:TrmH family RNA methyltransferase
MGACFRLPLWETTLPELRERLAEARLPLRAAALLEGAEDLRQVSLKRGAVVIGSEGRGVSSEVLAACDGGALKIPMRERCESLNAATAAAVILWVMSAEA